MGEGETFEKMGIILCKAVTPPRGEGGAFQGSGYVVVGGERDGGGPKGDEEEIEAYPQHLRAQTPKANGLTEVLAVDSGENVEDREGGVGNDESRRRAYQARDVQVD
jgi:hypothetical protein